MAECTIRKDRHQLPRGLQLSVRLNSDVQVSLTLEHGGGIEVVVHVDFGHIAGQFGSGQDGYGLP